MGFTRGSLTLPRMNAHRLVIVAAALTVVVAAALATALATFGGQALPRAVRQDLTGASGTTMVIRGQVTAAQAAQYSAMLPRQVAAALGALTAHAVLTSGHWPGAPVSGQPIPAALPATAAALLHLSAGDVLRMTDRVSGHAVRFVVTGLYRPRQVSGASAEYWGLDDVALSGSSTASGFTTYGPLTVQPAAFAGALTAYSGSWLAQPQTASIPGNH